MPLYEYRCEKCEHTFEDLVPLEDRDNGSACPKCSSKQVRRLVSAFAVGKASATSATSSCPTGTCSLS